MNFSRRRAYIPAAVPSLTLNGNKCSTLRKHRHCKYLSQSHIQQKSRFRDIHLAGGHAPEGRVGANYTLYRASPSLGSEYKKKEAICHSDNFLFRADGETRTHTGQRPLPPQSSVSTISPHPHLLWDCKCTNFFVNRKFIFNKNNTSLNYVSVSGL